ncbi:MAG: nucleoside triphosphate pyrophosphohydrolase [Candidatus Acidiferrales bacterium]
MSPRRASEAQSKKALAPKHGRGKLSRASAAKRANAKQTNRRAGELFGDLIALQAQLRAPGGCPWDREQTHATLRTFLLEETHEVLDAMESGDAKEFSSELGDLLLQIVFHSLIASETHQFDIRDVIESVHTKMVRRHPHVFGGVKVSTSTQVLKNWERLKAEEKKSSSGGKAPLPESLLDGIPRSLPALMEANQLTRRAAKIGFDWEKLEDILAKLAEEANELRAEISKTPKRENGKNGTANAAIEEEVGDLLFAAANIGRFLGLDPEIALLKANRKFKRRFQWMEKEAQHRGAALAETDRAQMEELWNDSKQPR